MTFLEAIPAGTIIELGSRTSSQLHAANFATVVGSLALSTRGDTIIVYCRQSEGDSFLGIKPLGAVSFGAHGWTGSGVDQYETHESALPENLIAQGSTELPHFDNYIYEGPRQGTSADLVDNIGNSKNWAGSNSEAIFFPESTTFLVFGEDPVDSNDGCFTNDNPGNSGCPSHSNARMGLTWMSFLLATYVSSSNLRLYA